MNYLWCTAWVMDSQLVDAKEIFPIWYTLWNVVRI